jgi:hypothetical protein
VQQHDIRCDDRDEQRQLRRDHSREIPLAEKEKSRREPRVVDRAPRHPLGHAAKQREGAERDDQRRQPQPGDEQRIQRAARAAGEDRACGGQRHRQMPIVVRRPEGDGGEPHHRSDRQIDPAGDDDRRERDGEQAELDAEPRDLEEISQREKVRRNRREEEDLAGQRQQQHPFAVREPSAAP